MMMMERGRRYWWIERDNGRGAMETVRVNYGNLIGHDADSVTYQSPTRTVTLPIDHEVFDDPDSAATFALGTACQALLTGRYLTALVLRDAAKPVHIDAGGVRHG